MTSKNTAPPECVTRTRQINSRWIVHHHLRQNTELYLEHLSQNDPPRLVSSCRNALWMIEQGDPLEDPKPWFYSGLFSLATADEAKQFLAGHWLTRIVTPAAKALKEADPETVGEITWEKIRRLREALARRTDQSA
jgi:hypothetical protein